jgi:hypothetical protein
MAGVNKKAPKIDLEKIAAQLASVRILAVAGEERLVLRATVKFTTKSFDAGQYRVSVGVKQSILNIDHPSYEIDRAYQATLPKETWSESWKESRSSHISGEAKVHLGAKLLNIISFSGGGQVGKDQRETAELRANAPYRIVAATPTGWQIGTELGDPRDPGGTLPNGLEHCLNGEYLTGRNGEHGEGLEKDGSFALCELRPVSGGNDPSIVATLVAASGSVQIAVNRLDSTTVEIPTLQIQKEKFEREEALRKAFIDICLQRAEIAHKSGARTEAMLSGELYLSHHEVHGPRISLKASETNAAPREKKE